MGPVSSGSILNPPREMSCTTFKPNPNLQCQSTQPSNLKGIESIPESSLRKLGPRPTAKHEPLKGAFTVMCMDETIQTCFATLAVSTVWVLAGFFPETRRKNLSTYYVESSNMELSFTEGESHYSSLT